MKVEDLERLYDYGYWANRTLIRMVSQLPPEQFTQTVAGSYGSIRNTLVHALSAEWGWLARCGGPERGPALAPEDYPTLGALVQQWNTVERHLRGFLRGLRDVDLDRSVEFTNGRGEKRALPLGELLHHSATHAVHHRGQVALLLRMLGHAPGNFDLLLYYAERRGVPAW